MPRWAVPCWSYTVTSVFVLLDALDPGRGQELDAAGFLRAFEQRQVHVDAVDHRVGVAEALDEGLAGGNLADLVLVEGVVHHHVVGIDRAAARLVADAQGVEGVEGVGAELDTGADLADLSGLFEDLHPEALAHEGEGGGEAADAAAGDEHGKRLLGCLLGHGRLLRQGRVYSGWPMFRTMSPTSSTWPVMRSPGFTAPTPSGVPV